MGRAPEAAADLNRGVAASPTRADLYFAATLFLIKHDRLGLALQLLQKAATTVADSPELLLTQSMAFGLARQFENSYAVLGQIESRWPEWGRAYLIHGIVLVGQAKMPEAKPLLQTAIALGVRDPLAFYNLALTDMEAFPSDVDGAYAAIQQALQLDPADAYIQSLAGNIDYTRKDYNSALRHLTEAIHLWPDMVEAHQRLAATYRALGDKQREVAELKTVLRIKQQTRTADQAPPSDFKNLLFSVPAPAPPTS
jgi:tetratricopeptide (TPR) repeat protein